MRRVNAAKVIWLTGLSGSGKSTLGRRLCAELSRGGAAVEFLDGDEVRQVFPQLGFTRDARDAHIRQMGFLASRLEAHGVTTVAAFISPFREARDFARSLCRCFVEIHLSASLAACERRDPKGLYAKARRGEIPFFTGVSGDYEEPLVPELRLDTERLDEPSSLARILAYLKRT